MRLLLIFYFSICFLFTFSQGKIETVVLDSINLNADSFIGLDAFDNYYAIDDNALIKYDKNNKIAYKNISLGTLTTVDILNPLQLVLFYKPMNTIVVLDNQLNEVFKINGNDYNLIFSSAGLTIQNNLWFFDLNSLKIGLFNFENKNYKFISTPLKSIIKDFNSNYNSFYWIDENNELYSISFFGKIQFFGKTPNYDSCEIVSGEVLILNQKESLKLYTTKNEKAYTIPITEKSLYDYRLKNEILSIFTNNKVTNYKITLP